MHRLGPRARPLVFLPAHARGVGAVRSFTESRPGASRREPRSFAVVPSRHRYYLPAESPGWTFAWIGIYHPYVLRRIAKQVAAHRTSGRHATVERAGRQLPCAWCAARSKRTFGIVARSSLALFELMLAYERLADELRDPEGDRERLLEWLAPAGAGEPAKPAGTSTRSPPSAA